MICLLLRVVVVLGSSAIGLLVAAWLIPGVTVRPLGFLIAFVIFTVAQAILAPFLPKMASRYASAFLGGIDAWVAATVVVWLVTAVATLLLPMLVLKKKVA